jgi:hypothetical protein
MSITNYTGTYQNYLGYLGAKKCCELRGLGPKGDQGSTGPPGPIGIGEKGARGEQGATGEAGPAGTSGLYCCYGNYLSPPNQAISNVLNSTVCTVVMQGESLPLLANILYAVNISFYISSTTAMTNPNVTFNLSNVPVGYGAPFYPVVFSNNTSSPYNGVPMYLNSNTISGPSYVYTGSINDYLLCSSTADLPAPILNIYINTATSSSTASIKITATIHPVSG